MYFMYFQNYFGYQIKGTQLLIAIIDARSIANAYYYVV